MPSLFDPIDTAVADAKAAYAAEVRGYQDTIAELQRKLDEATKPKGGLVVGIDVATLNGDAKTPWDQLVREHRALFGPAMPNVRVYYSPGEALQWDSAKKKPQFDALNGPDECYVSIKTISRASFTAWLDKMPAKFRVPGKRVKVCYFHECEADAKKSGRYTAWVTSYLATYDMMKQVVASHPNGQFVELRKIMLYFSQVLDTQARGTGLPPLNKDSWSDFDAGQGIPLDMDIYWPQWTNNGQYEKPEVLFAKLLQIRTETGLNVGVPEFGGLFKDGKRTADDRAAAIDGALTWLRDQGFEFVNWWCSGTDGSNDGHLEKYPSNLAVWRAHMAKNPR